MPLPPRTLSNRVASPAVWPGRDRHWRAPAAVDVRIREFQREDIDGVYYLDQRCYPPHNRFAYHQLVSTLLERDVVAVVAEAPDWRRPGVVAALVVRADYRERRLSVVSLMVEAPLRRQGLGRHLMAWAAEIARGQRLDTVAVPIEADNEDAAAFLAACGLADTGQHAPYFTEAAAGAVWELDVVADAAGAAPSREAP